MPQLPVEEHNIVNHNVQDNQQAEQVEHLEIPNMDAADEVIDPQPNIVEDPPADDEQINYSFQQDLSDEHSSADSVVNASVVNALPDLNAVPGGEVVPANDVPGDEDAPVIVLGMEAPAGLAAIAGLGAHAEPKLVAPHVGQIMGEDLGSMDVWTPLHLWSLIPQITPHTLTLISAWP
jgi:hypothetical protein